MRVFVILACIALAHGAKLERAYLPPSSAGTAGGSGSFLQTPLSDPSQTPKAPSARNYNAPFATTGNEFSPSGTDFGKTGRAYTQPGSGFPQNVNDFAQAGTGFAPSGNDYAQSGNAFPQAPEYNFVQQRPERPRATLERNAAILRQDSSNDGETYSYAYETENGIYAEESGVATNGVQAQGGFSYTGDDGQVYSIRYTADENGFVPQGDHLPTPPPVPEEILRALEQNARDEAAGIYDDGSYNESKYSSATDQYYQNNAYGNTDDAVVTNSAFARAGNARAFDAPAPSYGATNAQSFDAPAQSYGASNAQTFDAPTSSYDAPNTRAYNANSAAPGPNAVAPTYGAPEATGAPAARSFNAPTYNAPSGNAQAPSARNLATEKAYLPPLANQRGQTRNAFGRRQSFDARTGYNY